MGKACMAGRQDDDMVGVDNAQKKPNDKKKKKPGMLQEDDSKKEPKPEEKQAQQQQNQEVEEMEDTPGGWDFGQNYQAQGAANDASKNQNQAKAQQPAENES